MKFIKVGMIALAVCFPVFGFGKSGPISFGDITLDPQDTISFSLDDAPDAIGGYEVLSEYLPQGVEVTWTGKKFKLPKAGKVKYSKKDEDFYSTSDDNPAGLKLTINKKTGAVKGSFKIYVQKSEKKTKSYSAKVVGTVGGTLKVTIKKVGTYTATLE